MVAQHSRILPSYSRTHNDEVSLISNRPANLLIGGPDNRRVGNSVESNLLEAAIDDGAPHSEVDGDTFIKVYPLPRDVVPGCVTCHTDFSVLDAGAISGALSIKVDLTQ